MSKKTIRDMIWNTALKNESTTVSYLTEQLEVSDRTARDALNTMHNMGWLEKEENPDDDGYIFYSVIDPEPREKVFDQIYE